MLDLSARSYSIVVARFVSGFDYDLGCWLVSTPRAAISRFICLRPLTITGTPSPQRLVHEQECQPLDEANDGLLIGRGVVHGEAASYPWAFGLHRAAAREERYG